MISVNVCSSQTQILKDPSIMMDCSCRQSRFLVWASDIESRVDKGSAAEDPEEVLRRLETELQAEVALKSREVDWLLHSGSELAQAYAGDGETEGEQRKEIEYKVQQVNDAWNRLQNLSKSRANKLHDILQVLKLIELEMPLKVTDSYFLCLQLAPASLCTVMLVSISHCMLHFCGKT